MGPEARSRQQVRKLSVTILAQDTLDFQGSGALVAVSMKGEIVKLVKSGQRNDPMWQQAWLNYISMNGNGNSDPAEYDEKFLCDFVNWLVLAGSMEMGGGMQSSSGTSADTSIGKCSKHECGEDMRPRRPRPPTSQKNRPTETAGAHAPNSTEAGLAMSAGLFNVDKYVKGGRTGDWRLIQEEQMLGKI